MKEELSLNQDKSVRGCKRIWAYETVFQAVFVCSGSFNQHVEMDVTGRKVMRLVNLPTKYVNV